MKTHGDSVSQSATLHEIREKEFPGVLGQHYLNTASFGPMPESTRQVVERFNRMRGSPGELTDDVFVNLSSDARVAAARFVGCDAAEIALISSTSFGLTTVAHSLGLTPGDAVIVSHGEFPANVYPWLMLERRGVDTRLVELKNGLPDIDKLLDLATEQRVKVLAISLVQSHTGYRCDLDRITEHCHANDVTVVLDAIQGLGCFPFRVRDSGVDVLVTGAQKWLMSPWSAGFMYVKRELFDSLEPSLTSWLGYRNVLESSGSLLEYDTELADDARRYEMGTLPYQDLAGMIESLSLIERIGTDVIQANARTLRAPVENLDGAVLEVVSPTDAAHDSSIVSVRTSNVDRSYQALNERGVVCSKREGLIRLAPHIHSTIEEMELVAETLKSVS